MLTDFCKFMTRQTGNAFLGCDRTCKTPNENDQHQTWLCNENCQDLSLPCNGTCTTGYFLDCNKTCAKKRGGEPYLCGQECYESWRPCNGSCQLSSSKYGVKCRGQDACYDDHYLWKCPFEYRSGFSDYFILNLYGK